MRVFIWQPICRKCLLARIIAASSRKRSRNAESVRLPCRPLRAASIKRRRFIPSYRKASAYRRGEVARWPPIKNNVLPTGGITRQVYKDHRRDKINHRQCKEIGGNQKLQSRHRSYWRAAPSSIIERAANEKWLISFCVPVAFLFELVKMAWAQLSNAYSHLQCRSVSGG